MIRRLLRTEHSPAVCAGKTAGGKQRVGRFVRFLAILGASVALTTTPASAATYTIYTSGDSYIESDKATDNFGNNTTLEVRTKAGDHRRAVFKFDLSSIPAGETVTSAVLHVYVSLANAGATTNIHRITDTWTESTVTWANTNTDFDATADGSFLPNSTGLKTVTITSLVQEWRGGTANYGIMFISSGNDSDSSVWSEEALSSANFPRLVVTTSSSSAPTFALAKTSQATSDPFNGTTNPKRIPRSHVTYVLGLSNSGSGSPDANSVVVTEPVPTNTKLFVNDLGAAGSGPVLFTNGSPSSSLTYAFTNLASTTDNLSFSNDGGATYDYTPTAGADGCDAAVTHFRVNPQGTFAGASGGSPSFNLQFKVLVK